MPLTHKGAAIRAALTKEYGAKKGEQVLYAGKNKGTFTGIDAQPDPDNIHGYMDAVRRGDSAAMASHFKARK